MNPLVALFYLLFEVQLREFVVRIGEKVLRDASQGVHAGVVGSLVVNHLELEAKHSETILVLQGLGHLLVVNVPVDHVEFYRVLVAVNGVLGAPDILIVLHLPPVEMHLHKLIVDVERPPAQQGRGVVGHGEQLEGGASVLGEGLVEFGLRNLNPRTACHCRSTIWFQFIIN